VDASSAGVPPQYRLLWHALRQVHREVMPLSRDTPRIRGCIVEKTKTLLLRYCVFAMIIHSNNNVRVSETDEEERESVELN